MGAVHPLEGMNPERFMLNGAVELIILGVAFFGLQLWWLSRVLLFKPRRSPSPRLSSSLETQRRQLEKNYGRL